MTTTVFLVVIGAALLHAAWNGFVKGSPDKFASMCALSLGHFPIAALAALTLPLPAPESWPFLITGVLLHLGYQIVLAMAYRAGDLSQVYPIARGVAPLLVAAISVAVLGVQLLLPELIGIAVIGAGILSLALVRKSDGLRNPVAAALALLTGGFIAAYSLVDGYGARASGSPVAFYAWLSMGTALCFCLVMALWKPGVIRRAVTDHKRLGLFGGSASFVAFAMVMWAFTQAPIPLVTALRETSIVFALLIGVFFLKERLNLVKLAATLAALLGAALLRFAQHF